MENKEQEMSFEELFANSMKEDTKLGKTVTGTVIEINRKGEIIVDLNYKADGIVPKEEQVEGKEFKVGDTICCDVVKMNDGFGNVLLSYRRFMQRNAKKELEQKIEQNEIIEAKVTEVTDKGFVTMWEGIRIFIPLSLTGLNRGEDAKQYLGKVVRFRIIEHDWKTRRVIGSMKSVLEEEKEKQEKEFWDTVEIGKEYKGIVNSMSSYGAFVEIGPVKGLLHISEMAWGRNEKPEDILSQGQEIKVRIKALDKDNKRLMLTFEGKGPDPWGTIEEKYHVGDIVRAKIVKLMPFGAFAEIEKGIEGLIHISQITEKRISKPEEVLQEGNMVNVKIIELDKENKKLELSMKELEGTSNEYKE